MFETYFPEIVTIDSVGNLTGKVIDFCKLFRIRLGRGEVLMFQKVTGKEWKCAPCLGQQRSQKMFG